MQFKVVRHRDKEGRYHEGNTVQCLRYVRQITPENPEGKNVQRVVAKFDRWTRELPADTAALLSDEERGEWKNWRGKHDDLHHRTVAQFELDSLAERLTKTAEALKRKIIKIPSDDAGAIWDGIDALSSALKQIGAGRPKRPRGRPVKIAVEDDGMGLVLLPNFATPGTPEFESYQKLLEEHARRKVKEDQGA